MISSQAAGKGVANSRLRRRCLKKPNTTTLLEPCHTRRFAVAFATRVRIARGSVRMKIERW